MTVWRWLKAALPVASLCLLLPACDQTDLAGTPPPDARIDTYIQEAAGKIDVLWVIDNSPTMAAHRKNVADNFSDFFAALVRSDVDFHVGITTTDLLNDNGRLVGDPEVITSATRNPIAAFAENIQVGESGAAWEQGLEAARRTLDLHSGGFIREDAYLFLIFVSDEDDQSPTPGPYHFYRYFKSYKGKGNEQMVSAGAIAGDLPNGCIPARCGQFGCSEGSGAGDAKAGERYHELVSLMGGQIGSICDEAFSAILFEMGMDAVGLLRKFELSEVPANPDELTVEVRHPCDTPQEVLDSACIDYSDQCSGDSGYFSCNTRRRQEGETDGFDWEHSTNSIVLYGRAIPPKGAIIAVSYMEKRD